MHHNKLRDGLAKLVGKSFTPAYVRNDPKIFTDCAVWGRKSKGKETGKSIEAPLPEEWG